MASQWKTILGAILFFIGFMSIVFALVGLRFSALGFIYDLGTGATITFVLSCLFGGIILMYLDRLDTDEPEACNNEKL